MSKKPKIIKLHTKKEKTSKVVSYSTGSKAVSIIDKEKFSNNIPTKK